MQKLLLLAAAGALGTLARYGITGAAQRVLGEEFPWGTLAANLIGCFLAGAFWSIAESRLSISGPTRTIVLMGFMGAFTTFSAFMLDTGQLVQNAQLSWALGNVALQNCCGIVLLFCGLAVGRLI
jgi:CrcB protein